MDQTQFTDQAHTYLSSTAMKSTLHHVYGNNINSCHLEGQEGLRQMDQTNQNGFT